MSFLWRSRASVESPQEALDAALERIDLNVTRLRTSAFAEDKMKAIQCLQEEAQTYPIEVGNLAMDSLLNVLKYEPLADSKEIDFHSMAESDNASPEMMAIDMVISCIETLSAIIGYPRSNPTSEKLVHKKPVEEYGLQFTEILMKDPSNLSLIVSLLEFNYFYLQYDTLQLLKGLIHNGRIVARDQLISSSPQLPSLLVQLLSNSRDSLRNEGIYVLLLLLDPWIDEFEGEEQVGAYDDQWMLATLSNKSFISSAPSFTRGERSSGATIDLQKILAFENSFEKVIDILKAEVVYRNRTSQLKSLIDPNPIVLDCLKFLILLLLDSASNARYFCETKAHSQIHALLLKAIDSTDENELLQFHPLEAKGMLDCLFAAGAISAENLIDFNGKQKKDSLLEPLLRNLTADIKYESDKEDWLLWKQSILNCMQGAVSPIGTSNQNSRISLLTFMSSFVVKYSSANRDELNLPSYLIQEIEKSSSLSAKYSYFKLSEYLILSSVVQYSAAESKEWISFFRLIIQRCINCVLDLNTFNPIQQSAVSVSIATSYWLFTSLAGSLLIKWINCGASSILQEIQQWIVLPEGTLQTMSKLDALQRGDFSAVEDGWMAWLLDQTLLSSCPLTIKGKFSLQASLIFRAGTLQLLLAGFTNPTRKEMSHQRHKPQQPFPFSTEKPQEFEASSDFFQNHINFLQLFADRTKTTSAPLTVLLDISSSYEAFITQFQHQEKLISLRRSGRKLHGRHSPKSDYYTLLSWLMQWTSSLSSNVLAVIQRDWGHMLKSIADVSGYVSENTLQGWMNPSQVTRNNLCKWVEQQQSMRASKIATDIIVRRSSFESSDGSEESLLQLDCRFPSFLLDTMMNHIEKAYDDRGNDLSILAATAKLQLSAAKISTHSEIQPSQFEESKLNPQAASSTSLDEVYSLRRQVAQLQAEQEELLVLLAQLDNPQKDIRTIQGHISEHQNSKFEDLTVVTKPDHLVLKDMKENEQIEQPSQKDIQNMNRLPNSEEIPLLPSNKPIQQIQTIQPPPPPPPPSAASLGAKTAISSSSSWGSHDPSGQGIYSTPTSRNRVYHPGLIPISDPSPQSFVPAPQPHPFPQPHLFPPVQQQSSFSPSLQQPIQNGPPMQPMLPMAPFSSDPNHSHQMTDKFSSHSNNAFVPSLLFPNAPPSLPLVPPPFSLSSPPAVPSLQPTSSIPILAAKNGSS